MTSAYQFKGRMLVKEGTLDFTATESSDDGEQGTGSGTLAGKPFSYLAVSGEPYLKGQSFWQTYYGGQPDEQTKVKGFEDNYADALGNDVVDALRALTDLGGASECLDGAGSVKKGAQRTINGRRATALTSCGDTYWVVPGRSDQLVGFKAARADAVTTDDLQNVDVTIVSTKAPDVSTPAGSVDPSVPSTLPALYHVQDANDGRWPSDDCAENACTLHAHIRNDGGRPQGTSTVQLTALDPNTLASIASCSVSIPDIPNNLDQDVSCTVSGAAWNAWAATAGANDTFFHVDARITVNPPYVG